MPRAPKACGHHGCHARVTGKPYCTVHTAEQQVRANTTQRGYGIAHQRTRTHALRDLRPGQPCHLCGKPMWPHQRLDLDHTTDRTAYRGLAHAHCNAVAGAISKTQRRGPGPSPAPQHG